MMLSIRCFTAIDVTIAVNIDFRKFFVQLYSWPGGTVSSDMAQGEKHSS